MTAFLSSRLRGMKPYVPGEQPRDQQYIKLNTNESPYPPSPGVIRAVERAAENLNLYSDPELLFAREKLAAFYGVPTACVLLTNGSDDALNDIALAFGDDDRPFLFPDITYGLYPVLCALYRLPYREIPLREDFSVDTEAMRAQKGTILLANPNAPTGMALPRAEIAALAAGDPDRLVIVDEAYVDFGGESCVPLTQVYPNLLVVQTYSKFRSLAGARLGILFGPEALIRDLNAVRCSINPYNVNSMSLAAAAAAIDEDAYYRENSRRVTDTRAWTEGELQKLGFTVLPSRTNFLFASPPDGDGAGYYRALKERGVLVRHFNKPRIAPFVRISIGSREQMQALIARTRAILKEAES